MPNPSSVGRYQLLQTIGEGGMGVVYKAFDPLLERTLAIKLISARLDEFPDLRTRFFSEARAAGRLSHKNIVTIYDLGEENGQPYFAMELLEGRNLRMRMHSPVKMSLERKLDIIRQVSEGLAYAHARGIIHRDIKPANLFVIGSGQIKILDFGLARLPNSDVTRSRTLLGTFNYMAPEQINGETVDHRADIFAVGVVMYELLAERLPFKGESAGSVLHKILKEEPEPLDRVNPRLPRSVCALVNRAMAKAREERYADFGELLIDLAACRPELQSVVQLSPAALIRSDTAGPVHPRIANDVVDASTVFEDDAVVGRRLSGSAGGAPSTSGGPGTAASSWSKMRVRPVRLGLAGLLMLGLAAGWAVLGGRQDQRAQVAPRDATALASRGVTPGTADTDRGRRPDPQIPPALAVPPAAPTSGTERPTVEGTRGRLPHRTEAHEADARESTAGEQARREADSALRDVQAHRDRADHSRSADLAASTYSAARTAQDEAVQLLHARRFDAATRRLREAAALFAAAETEAATAQARVAEEERQQARDRDRAVSLRTGYIEARGQATRAATDRLAPAAFRQAEQRASDAQASFDRGNWADAGRAFEGATSLLQDAQRLARESPAAANAEAGSANAAARPPSAETADVNQSAERAIHDVLGRYAAAFQSRSMPALKRVWPSLTGTQERAIRDEFEHASSIGVTLSNPRIDVAGSAAVVTCHRVYELTTDDGRRLQSDTATTLTLRKGDSGWVIDSVRYDGSR